MDAHAETLIELEPEAVAAMMFDPMHDTEWISGIREVQRVTDGPIEVGSRVARIASFLGKRIEYVLQVNALEPGKSMTMDSIKGPFPMRVEYILERQPEGTRARIILDGDATGFFRLAEPLLNAASRRAIQRDLDTLKRVLEARAEKS